MSSLWDTVRTVCDLVELLRRPGSEPFVLDADAPLQQQLDNLLLRLRYEALSVPGINWDLCSCLNAQSDQERATRLRHVALSLESHGLAHDLLVALLAAGHGPQTARDAVVVLSRESGPF